MMMIKVGLEFEACLGIFRRTRVPLWVGPWGPNVRQLLKRGREMWQLTVLSQYSNRSRALAKRLSHLPNG